MKQSPSKKSDECVEERNEFDCRFVQEILLGLTLKPQSQSLTPLFSHPSHLSSIKIVVVSGSVVASGSDDDTIHLYDLSATSSLGSLHQHSTSVNLPFPRNLISANSVDSLAIFDADNFIHLTMLSVHCNAAINDLALHSSGERALTVALTIDSPSSTSSAVPQLLLAPRQGSYSDQEKGFVHQTEDARIFFELECSKIVLCAALARVLGVGCGRGEAFFDSKPWLDSDCEDDFYRVNGGKDFLKINRVYTPEDVGTVGTIRAISHHLTAKDNLVVSGDLITDVPLGAVAATHKRHDAIGYHASRIEIRADMMDAHLYASILQEVLDQKSAFHSLKHDVLPYLFRSQLKSEVLFNGMPQVEENGTEKVISQSNQQMLSQILANASEPTFHLRHALGSYSYTSDRNYPQMLCVYCWKQQSMVKFLRCGGNSYNGEEQPSGNMIEENKLESLEEQRSDEAKAHGWWLEIDDDTIEPESGTLMMIY
ncbi:hypothetical protein V8G54_002438 [Vigna mungo]|uniref:Translation initiation factor eIF2B subunit gamma n=1 Tax=Vigna mungo TaxID=3915 RepID=A0AAQ3P9U2_VIGMU